MNDQHISVHLVILSAFVPQPLAPQASLPHVTIRFSRMNHVDQRKGLGRKELPIRAGRIVRKAADGHGTKIERNRRETVSILPGATGDIIRCRASTRGGA